MPEEVPLSKQSPEEVRKFVDRYQEENPYPKLHYWGGSSEGPPYFTIIMALGVTLLFFLLK